MKFKRWLYANKISVNDFADQLGCSRIHLYELLNEKRRPSKILAKAILNATNGEITERDLFNFPKKQKIIGG